MSEPRPIRVGQAGKPLRLRKAASLSDPSPPAPRVIIELRRGRITRVYGTDGRTRVDILDWAIMLNDGDHGVDEANTLTLHARDMHVLKDLT